MRIRGLKEMDEYGDELGKGKGTLMTNFRGVGEKRKVIHYNTYVLYTRRVMKGGRAAYRPAEFRRKRGLSC